MPVTYVAAEILTHLLIFPNREKIISKSSAVVTGLSLQTNSTFSGGAARHQVSHQPMRVKQMRMSQISYPLNKMVVWTTSVNGTREIT